MKNNLAKSKLLFLRLSKRTKIIIIFLLLAVIGFSIYKFVFSSTPKVTYQTEQAEKGILITSVTASGSIVAASSASVETSATGIVSTVYVKDGDTVQEGQKIAEIKFDRSGLQKQTAAYANLLSAQNNVNAATAKLNSLQSALFTANQKFVNDKGSTTDPDTDDPNYIIENANWLQAEADYKNQQGVIAQAQASLTNAQIAYDLTSGTVTAPMAGMIANLSFTQGLLIDSTSNTSSSTSNASTSNTTSTTSYGTVVMEGSQPQASVNVSEVDIPNVKVGQKVTMTMDAFSGKTFTGKVTAIDTNGSVSSGVTTYPATITFDSAPNSIYPNMAVSATIITNIKNDVLLISSSAVQTSNGTSTVRVMKYGKISSVTVETGESNDTQIEIVSGLNEGDTVVTSSVSTGTKTSSGSTSSPFGNTGFGGAGGGNMMFRSSGSTQRSSQQR